MAREYTSDSIAYRPNTETLRHLDALVKRGLYKSRADAVDAFVQRGLAWEEYIRLVNQQLADVTKDPAFLETMAEALIPVVREEIQKKLS